MVRAAFASLAGTLGLIAIAATSANAADIRMPVKAGVNDRFWRPY